jgi:hypothetical protein
MNYSLINFQYGTENYYYNGCKGMNSATFFDKREEIPERLKTAEPGFK